MTPTPATPGAAAEFFRLGLVSHTMGVEAVEDWATHLFSDTPSPSFALCDLATAKSIDPSLVLDALRTFPKDQEDRDSAWAMFCKDLQGKLKSGKKSLENSVRTLYRLQLLHEAPKHLEGPIIILEDTYSLTRDGIWGTMEEVQEETLNLLKAFFDDETPNPLDH